jgi:hypothetical protein
MNKQRFPYEQTEWHCGESERWLKTLERYDAENVRSVLYGPYRDTGSRSDITIGTTQMVKGFAQEWLAWHDREKSNQETTFRKRQIFWARWTAISATVTAIAGVIITIGSEDANLVFAASSPPHSFRS